MGSDSFIVVILSKRCERSITASSTVFDFSFGRSSSSSGSDSSSLLKFGDSFTSFFEFLLTKSKSSVKLNLFPVYTFDDVNLLFPSLYL